MGAQPDHGSDRPHRDPDRRIACRACGYDLRGIERRQACPECATPVTWSTHGYRLTSAGSPFVRKIRAGALCAIVSPAIFLASLLPVSSRVPDSWQAAGQNPGIFLMIASAVFLVVGAWMLLSQDPSEPPGARRPGLMRLGRTAAVAVAAVPALAAFIEIVGSGLSDSAGTKVVTVELLLLGAVVFAMGTQARRVASRLDDPSLEARANRSRWLLPGALALLGGTVLWPRPSAGDPPGPAGVVAALSLLTLVAAVMFFGTLASLYARLRPAALNSRRRKD